MTFVQFLRFLLSVVVSFLPARLKKLPFIEPLSTSPAHAVGGVLEAFTFIALYYVGFIRAVESFTQTGGWVYWQEAPTWSYGDLFGIGATGYIGFLLNPLTWMYLTLFIEGIIRAIDAANQDHCLGSYPFWLVTEGVVWLVRVQKRAKLRSQLGPKRPDEVIHPNLSSSGLLEIYTMREKSWSPDQMVLYSKRYYRLVSKNLVDHKRYKVYRYLLRMLADNEIIRGRFIHYPE